MITELNITYDVTDALEYYDTLCNDFKHLHWWYLKDHNDPLFIDDKNKLNQMNGWGLQTVYNDMSFPYHCDLDPHDEGPAYFKPTPLVFGFAERLLSIFPDPYRACLYVHAPTTHINRWEPGGPKHGKIVVPIKTNSKSLITCHTTPIVQVNPKLGIIYFIKPTHPLETINLGDTDDVFIVFNIPEEHFEIVDNLKVII